MTETGANDEVRGFKKYFEVRQVTSPTWEAITAFTKWYFDLVKNIMIVAALQLVGEKTGYIPVKAVAWFSGFLIAAYSFAESVMLKTWAAPRMMMLEK